MPKPRPGHEGTRSTLNKLSEDLESLSKTVRGLNDTSTPLAFAVSKATLRIAIMRGRIYRLLNPDEMPASDQIPTLAEVADDHVKDLNNTTKASPWLTAR
jgi:hypothetical protein